jgi:hypothetical protein
MTPALDRLRRPFDHHADGLAVLAERGLTFDDCLDDLDPEALWPCSAAPPGACTACRLVMK